MNKQNLGNTVSMLNALAQETRLKAFRSLMAAGHEGLAAGKLAESLGVAPNNLSVHLSVLSHAGLISVKRAGRFQIYSANISAINTLLTSLVETCCGGHPDVCKLVNTLGCE